MSDSVVPRQPMGDSQYRIAQEQLVRFAGVVELLMDRGQLDVFLERVDVELDLVAGLLPHEAARLGCLRAFAAVMRDAATAASELKGLRSEASR